MTKLFYTRKAVTLANKLNASEAYIEAFIYSKYGAYIGIKECSRIAGERFDAIKQNPIF